MYSSSEAGRKRRSKRSSPPASAGESTRSGMRWEYLGREGKGRRPCREACLALVVVRSAERWHGRQSWAPAWRAAREVSAAYGTAIGGTVDLERAAVELDH